MSNMKNTLYRSSLLERIKKRIGLYRNPNLDTDKLRPLLFDDQFIVKEINFRKDI